MPKHAQEFFKFLSSRSAEIITAQSLQRKLASPRKLRVKLGIDPTSPDLHLGHIVPLLMLRAFQDAGHQAVLIIGDFTAQIGDPAGAEAARRQLTPAEVKRNERTYLSQIGPILDLKKAEMRHNSEWFKPMTLKDFLSLLTHFSLRSAWQRQDFQKRLKAGREVRLHEAMYHVLQGYDSVAVRADVELGSRDQKLNMLAGRWLQTKLEQTPQDIVLLPYLIGLDGRNKMSKSVGNTINLRDSAGDMFGKVMSIPDGLIVNYAELAAWFPLERIRRLKSQLARGSNPRDVKLGVAEAIVRLYHGVPRAQKARAEFVKLFSRKEVPDSIPKVRLGLKAWRPLELLAALKVTRSKSEARRLIAGRAVEVDGRTIAPSDGPILLRRGSVVRVGKKKFFRVV